MNRWVRELRSVRSVRWFLGGLAILCAAWTALFSDGFSALRALTVLLVAWWLIPELSRAPRRARADSHLLIVPPGRPSLRGGPRSTMIGWAHSSVPCTVLTSRGGQAEAFAQGLGLEVEHGLLLPDPEVAEKRHARVARAVWWLLWGGRRFVHFASVEVEWNHVLEIGPAAVWWGRPLVASLRDVPRSRPGRLKKLSYVSISRVYTINRATTSWAISHAGREDTRHIPVPVLEREPTLELLDRPTEKRVVIVGFLSPKKGQLEFIEDVMPLLDEDWSLDLVGDTRSNADYSRRCREAAASFGERIRFHGHVEDWRRSNKRFVLGVNSISEGGPRVAIEALAMGVPVVLGDFPGAETYREVPMARVVDEVPQWPSALDSAHEERLPSAERQRLLEFLSMYRVEAVGEELTRLHGSLGSDGGTVGAVGRRP